MSEGEGPAEAGIGLAAFDSLHAEAEPWLAKCRVMPAEFELIVGSRSYLVVGSEGMGKTALFQALRARLEPPADNEHPPEWLVVHWRPHSLEAGLVGKAAAESQLSTVLAACADRVLNYLARWPRGFLDAPEDMQHTVAWFLDRYLGPEMEKAFDGLLSQDSPAGSEELVSILRRAEPDEWLSRAESNEIVGEVIKALRSMGLEAIYVLVSPDDLGDSRYLAKELEAFLSSLTLFEHPHFVYKIVLPEHLLESLSAPVAIDRRRIELAVLDWRTEDLQKMIVERVKLATGGRVTDLEQVCEDKKLIQWLKRTGGNCPRGWLQSFKPLMVWHLHWKRPVKKREWREIRQSPPPALRLVDSTTIMVGWRRIKVSEIPLALFAYLYENRGRVCTRQEIYEEAYLPAAYPDSTRKRAEAGTGGSHLPGQEYPKEYDRILDSTISRLRKLVEPDPDSPLYLITERGTGYILENVR